MCYPVGRRRRLLKRIYFGHGVLLSRVARMLCFVASVIVTAVGRFWQFIILHDQQNLPFDGAPSRKWNTLVTLEVLRGLALGCAVVGTPVFVLVAWLHTSLGNMSKEEVRWRFYKFILFFLVSAVLAAGAVGNAIVPNSEPSQDGAVLDALVEVAAPLGLLALILFGSSFGLAMLFSGA